MFSLNQTIDTRIKLAHALARQWFGVYVTAEDPVDGMLSKFTSLYIMLGFA
jgi:transcription initiation factor TFIID subunit 2